MLHILTSEQFTKKGLLDLFQQAKKLQKAKKIPQTMKGKILATVFFEPSTRTRLSFETAMIRQGGEVISIPSAETSSLSKGETIQDTGRVVSTFADLIAVRTQEKGQVAQFAKLSSCPVINAGDGTGEHPTQHIQDLYTIWKSRGNLDGMTIGLMGDCKNSRVLRGMAKMVAQFKVKVFFIAPPELQVSQDIKTYLQRKGVPYGSSFHLEEVIDQLDVLDVNRIRHEYFEDKAKALEMGKQFIIDKKKILKGKKELIILDPLPRVNTVQEEVDNLPQAKYFEAVENGVFIRMVLMNKILH